MFLLELFSFYLFSNISFQYFKKEKNSSFLEDLFYVLLLFSFLFLFLEGKFSYLLTLLSSFFLFFTRFLISRFSFPMQKPIVLIRNGVLNFKELHNTNYSFQKFLRDLEKNGVEDIDEVEFAFLKGKRLLCIKK